MDIEIARGKMLGQQVRAWEVLDPTVLDVLGSLPREAFVPERYRNLAFADTQVPLGHGELMMTPKVEGRMLQALALKRSDRVLEIGTGSGFVTACLARLGGSVVSWEIEPEFSARAGACLTRFGIGNATLETRDGSVLPSEAPRFDAICVTGSLPELHPSFTQRLAVGGRLFAVVGTSPVMEARLITRVAEDGFAAETLFETDLPALRNAQRSSRFAF